MRFFRENRLENLCLNVIVYNFERYLHFESNQKKFEFLQRRYSESIYCLFLRNDMLKENFINWLISPFWKDVIIKDYFTLSNFVPKFIFCGQFMNSLNLQSSSAAVQILSAVICCLPNLKILNLNFTRCSDDLLKLIRKMCPLLHSLHLRECGNVTDIGMENLCIVNQEYVGFDSLKYLDIEMTSVEDDGIEYVLENLNLDILKSHEVAAVMCKIHHSIKNKCELKTYSLKSFDYILSRLYPMNLRFALKVYVDLCPDVEEIFISNLMHPNDYEFILKFQKLKSLKIVEFPQLGFPKDCGLTQFLEVKGEKLTELILVNLNVSVEVIARVCHSLKTLCLEDMFYQDIEKKNEKTGYYMDNLIKLQIKNACLYNKATYESIDLLLRACRNIEYLTFQYVRNFPEVFIDLIFNKQHLAKANFLFTDIKESSVKKLFTCKSISKLYLDGSPYVKTSECSYLCKVLSQTSQGNTLSWQIKYDKIIL